MKLLRSTMVLLLCLALAFVTMVFTAMAFARGWSVGLGFLGLIWLISLVFELLPWKVVAKVWLAAFAGYATGLLWQADRFTTDAHAEIVSGLPSSLVGGVGLGFYFVFVALLPWLAKGVAVRLKKMAGGWRGLALPVAWSKRRP